jgi:hypothetical protein
MTEELIDLAQRLKVNPDKATDRHIVEMKLLVDQTYQDLHSL